MESLSADEQQTAALAFAWLDTYRALSRGKKEAPAVMSVRPPRTGGGTPYEIWATITLFYVLHGFSKEVYPMQQTHEAVGLPGDFLQRVQNLLARLECEHYQQPAASSCCGEEEEAAPASVGY